MFTWQDWRSVENTRALENVRDKTSYAIQSQYSASPKMLALIDNFQKHLDPYADMQLFYDCIFNIHSAQGVGLDIWGLILQIRRVIEDPDTGVSIRLDDDYYRLLLLYKALANISASTAQSQNNLLSVLINTGIGGFGNTAYVLEVGTMVIRWVFEYSLDALQVAVFKAAGTLARGAGVGWELYAIDPDQTFGFDGSEMQPFNQAPFASDNALIIGVNNG